MIRNRFILILPLIALLVGFKPVGLGASPVSAAGARALAERQAAEKAASQKTTTQNVAIKAAGIQVLQPTPALTVDTSSGVVQGSLLGDTRAFLGIPYALPPVGARRWKMPSPYPRSSVTLNATVPGPGCLQPESTKASTGVGSSTIRGSEDCLHLNVWTPKTASAVPVLVFIHGGGFTTGSSMANSLKPGSLALYDGRDLSAVGGVVVVTLDYRLGALGYLAHPSLSAESGGRSGNYGVNDVIEALKWVRTNVTAFGGDPGNVTVFGESAGGMTICTLLASPKASGLFRSVILESFNCPAEPLADAEKRGASFATKLGCQDAACLRALPGETLVRDVNQYAPVRDPFLNELNFRPVIDGDLLTEPSRRVVREGRGLPVDVLAGHNLGEHPADSLTEQQKSWSADDFRAALVTQYGTLLGEGIFAVYYPARYPSVADAVADYKTDLQFSCPAELLLRAYARQGRSTYGYVFTQPPLALLQNLIRSLTFLQEGELHPLVKPFHGAELAYVFQKVDEAYATISAEAGYRIQASPLAQDSRTERHIGRYWTNFAQHADPNGLNVPRWPRYETSSRTLNQLEANPSPISNAYTNKCAWADAALDRD